MQKPILLVKGDNPTPIESSEFLSLPQLGQAASEDIVISLMMTAEVELPDAV